MEEKEQLERQRHSLAHIMAEAIQHLWPDAKFGVGPVINDGFYYDIDLGDQSLSEDDLPKISAEMQKIIKENQLFETFDLPIDEAIGWAEKTKQPYKLELLNDLKREGTTKVSDIDANNLGLATDSKSKVETVSFYKSGDFTDLCRGPHIRSTAEAGPFKLMRISGAYWRGKAENPQMQRIYGAAFKNQAELGAYLEGIEKAKKYDHRKLGQELDLFVISPLVGSGLPMFTPRGTVLRDELNRYSQELRKNIGYQNVWTPHIAKQELYEVSGHWAKFGDEWLTVTSQETNDKLVMKPMNCPHHQQIYASRQHSYRDLPLKYMETTTDYRDEKAGELLGLSRVRALTQDDSHAFCTTDQAKEILMGIVKVVLAFYKTFGYELNVRLSTHGDTDNYLGGKELWDMTEGILKDVIESSGLEFYVGKGEAAFYGPKIDFMSKDVLGKELQVATAQLDLIQPGRFNLKYTDEEGQDKTPAMIHLAIMGSIERFLATYIEHSMGHFPPWVAPEQVRLLTVNQDETTLKFAQGIVEKAQAMNLRVYLDAESESVGKKIRAAEMYKVPYILVIGSKEIDSGQLIPRIREDLKVNDEARSYSVDEFLKKLSEEVKARSSKAYL